MYALDMEYHGAFSADDIFKVPCFDHMFSQNCDVHFSIILSPCDLVAFSTNAERTFLFEFANLV